MPQDTQLIYTDTTADFPAEYDLPGSLDLTIQSVVARVDGAGAAGAFVPALSVYSQDGRLMARAPASQTFQPGDTGVVTWSPFLRQRVAAAAGGAIQWARKEDAGANQNVLSGINKAVPLVTTAQNTDATVFDMSVGNAIKVLVAGLFSVWARTDWTTYPGTQPQANREVWVVLNAADVVIAGVGVSPLDDFPQATGDIRLAAGDVLTLFVHQDSGGLDVLYGGVNNENALEVRYLGATA